MLFYVWVKYLSFTHKAILEGMWKDAIPLVSKTTEMHPPVNLQSTYSSSL